MTENEIITQKDPQMQMFSQLMQGTLKKLERYCLAARPMLGGEVYLTGEEVCSLLRLSTRTLQGLSGQRNDSLLQNQRQDTLQAKRHTSHARKTLLPNTQEVMTTIEEKR